MRKFLFLVVAVVLLVVADRVAVRVVDSVVASGIQKQQHLQAKPGVDITGFPFLTQVAAGKFDKITFTATGVRTEGEKSVVVDDIHADLTDVRATRDLSSITAGKAEGTGTVTYASLSQQLGATLSYDGTTESGQGRVQARKSATVLGQTLSATVSAALTVTGDTLRFSDVRVLDASVPQAVVSALEQQFAPQLSLSGLPSDLHVDSLSPAPGGITATLSGTDVKLK